MIQNFDMLMLKNICLRNYDKGRCGSGKCECQEICDMFKDNILPKDFELKTECKNDAYTYIVTETDGYSYSGSTEAQNLIDAVWEAIEHSTDCVRSVHVCKLPKMQEFDEISIVCDEENS